MVDANGREYCLKERDIAEVRAKLDSAFQRIDELRKLHEVLYEISGSIAVLVEQMRDTKQDVSSLKTDMEVIKRKPAEDFHGYQRMIVGGIIGAIVAFVMTQLLP